MSLEGGREAVVTDVEWRGTSLETWNAKLEQLPAQNVRRLLTWRNVAKPRLRILPREETFTMSARTTLHFQFNQELETYQP